MHLTFIFLLQFLIGFGVIDRFEIISRLPQKIALSVILGFFISTVSIFVLELFHISLTVPGIMMAVGATALGVNFNLPRLFRSLHQLIKSNQCDVKIYELIFLFGIGYLLFFSVWRTYAIPVTPYDSIVGIDLVAREAVKEGHIVSSIFYRPDFRPFLSTQPYYAPFTMLMQVIYQSAGLPFGQMWLGILTISFFVFAYNKLCERMHPVLAGFFVMLLITSPELYAYTFLLQTDFSNAVFFAIAIIFTIDFLESKRMQHLYLGALFMAAACWSRTETIILVLPVGAIIGMRSNTGFSWKYLLHGLGYISFCGFFTALWNVIFFKFYFPVVPKMAEQINWKGLYSATKSSEILNGMNACFFSTEYWGYFIYIFLAVWLANLLLARNMRAMMPLAWIVIFYFCFFIMLHHFTLMNIEYTFRRAIMKFLLLMCLMIGDLHILQRRYLLATVTRTEKG
jgi:hypothetical protein